MSNLMRALGIGPPKQTVGGFRVQTSVYGMPIPIIYGQARVAANLIHMPDAPQPTSGDGGKSGRATKGASGGQDYSAPVALALGEGPITDIKKVWRDKDEPVDFAANYATNGWSVFLGTSFQTPWGYLTTHHPAEAVPYTFTAYVVNPAVTMPNDSLSQYGWEVVGFSQFGGGVLDASGADIITDFLTNALHGANFPTARLASLTVYADYVAAAGLFCSPVFDSAQPARDHLNELLEITNSGAVWSDGVLKIVPYGDTPLTGNGHTYTPNTTPLYDLGDNDFLKNGGATITGEAGDQSTNLDLDPIIVRRVDPAAAYNDITVEYEDRAFDYNRVTAKAEDLVSITANGRLPMPTLNLHAIKVGSVARQVAQVRLQREQNVRNHYEFFLSWKYSLLEPMDLVTLTDAELGLSLTPVRIVSIEELASEQGFHLIAEEWPFGTATATLYGTGSAGGFLPNTNADPGNTTTPRIVEAPDGIKQAPLELWIGAQGGADWGGCEVHVSTDNVNFAKVGVINGKAIYGTLTATLASGTAWPGTDSVHTLAVNVGTAGRTLVSQSATDFAALTPLCYVDGEWCAYETASLTSAGHYDLTTLYRGLYNSTVASHASSSAFMFIDTTVFRLPFPQGTVGQVLYFKFPAFNTYGAQLQDVSTLSSVSYTLLNNPTPLGNDAPQGTISIDPISGNTASQAYASATADGGSATKSYRYDFSTSGFPVDATVAASGTIVSGRTFTVSNFATLNLGDTIYMTIVPFSASGANGFQLPSIHLRGTFSTFATLKSVTWAAQAWRSADPTYPDIVWNASNEPMNPQLDGLFPSGTGQEIFLSFALPVGVKIHDATFDTFWGSATTAMSQFVCTVRANAGYSNSGSVTYNGGNQTINFSLADTVIADGYPVQATILWLFSDSNPTHHADQGQANVRTFNLTYIMPKTDKTL